VRNAAPRLNFDTILSYGDLWKLVPQSPKDDPGSA